MSLSLISFVVILILLNLLLISGFSSSPSSSRSVSTMRSSKIIRMGLFDNLFGPKKTAVASHILIKSKGTTDIIALKQKIESSKDVEKAFAEAAAQFSSCPSAKNGGSLGKFSQGQMVPAFDKVVFSSAELGSVQGPVVTPFGEHLILIKERSE